MIFTVQKSILCRSPDNEIRSRAAKKTEKSYAQAKKDTAMAASFSSVALPSSSSSSSSLSFLRASFPSSLFPLPKFSILKTNPCPTIQAKAATRRENRTARHARVRKKVEGTPERPRLAVFRSNKHIYVQVIDDTKMHTLASASTMQKPVSEEFDYTSAPTIEVAQKVGEAIAKSCLEKGITKVAFDRGGYPYHGRVQALANAAREHGLQF